MNNTEINNLLNKYWNAETNIHEELKLKEYYNSGKVAEEHQDAAPLFQIFKMESSINASNIEIKAPTETLARESRVYQLNKSWRAIAAVFVIALASIFVVKSTLNTGNTSKKATIVNVEDPEEALAYTKMALAMVSKNYRKGSDKLSIGMENVNKMNIIK